MRVGVDYKCFSAAQGDYPIAIALEGYAIYEIEAGVTVGNFSSAGEHRNAAPGLHKLQ